MASRFMTFVSGSALLLGCIATHASLSPRLGGLAVYDSEQGITWLADAGGAGSARGAMTWADAVNWAATFSLGGATEWRLPATGNPDMSCVAPVTSSGLNCTGSEMGYLFYVQLSGIAGQAIANGGDPDLQLFTHLAGANWWSGTSFTIAELAWDFRFASGLQDAHVKSAFEFFAWPVHDGDVFGADSDGDGIADALDNCTEVANTDQRDTDSDGYGNVCDPDLNNDCLVNVTDLGQFKDVFFTVAPNADFNGDGVVNALDLGVLRALFFQPPGPSGTAPGCDQAKRSTVADPRSVGNGAGLRPGQTVDCRQPQVRRSGRHQVERPA